MGLSIHNNRDFKIQRRGRQRERKKKTKPIGSIIKTTTLRHAFLYISFLFLHDYNVKMPNFAFSSNDETLLLFLSLAMVPWNSASGGFAYIWQSKWVRIIAIKNEGTQIHFLSDVLVAVASLDLKVATKFCIAIKGLYSYRDDLPKTLFQITAQKCKKATSG